MYFWKAICSDRVVTEICKISNENLSTARMCWIKEDPLLRVNAGLIYSFFLYPYEGLGLIGERQRKMPCFNGRGEDTIDGCCLIITLPRCDSH